VPEKQRITALMDRLGRAMHNLQFAEGLNPAQWEALRYIAGANRSSRTPSAAAEYLGTTKGTASQTLKALEAKGCIERRPRAGDRRGVELVLTKHGASVLGRDPLTCLGDSLADMPETLTTVSAVLSQLVHCLQRASGTAAFGVCEDCDHACGACRDADGAPSLRCGLTGEPVAAEEIGKICANFEAHAG